MTTDTTVLQYRLAPSATLTPCETGQLYEIFQEGYCNISRAQFLDDLSWKDHVGILDSFRRTALRAEMESDRWFSLAWQQRSHHRVWRLPDGS